VVASDAHAGRAGRGRTTSANSYTLTAKQAEKVGRTAIVFQAAMAGPNSSSGQVMASLGDGQWVQVGSWTTESCKAAAAQDNWHVILFENSPLSGREAGQLLIRFDFKRGADHLAIQQVHWVGR